jgi:hypothetical protein
MANSNFIVQNGLTVGSTTIFAGNGDISTTGNITVSGGGSFGGLSTNQIYQSSANVTVSGSYVNVAIASTNVASFSSTGLTVSGSILPSANNSINIGSTSAWFSTFYGVSTQAKYADLAENYQADKTYMPGTVVMFGGDAEVTIASADTTAVAGVVSTNPAHLMNGGLSGPNVAAVALIGRVPCMVIGPVAKGDIMVSAGFGYAKANNTPLAGTIIGKALQTVTFAGKAVIEVVVGRT